MPARKEPHERLIPIGQRIRALRKAAGLTLEDLATRIEEPGLRRCGEMAKGHLSNIEHGRVSIEFVTAIGIARALGVSVAELAGEEAHHAS